MKTATAIAIEKRNLAHIEAINNPDNVLGLFKGERNWMLPGDFEEVNDTVEAPEAVRESETGKADHPFLNGMICGVGLSVLVELATLAVILL